MFSRFKRFDVHVKAIDGVNQQTVLGALLTIVSCVLVMILILSEISYFLKIDVVSRMLTDSTVGVEAVRLDFHLIFHHVSCEQITFTKEVTKGTIRINDANTMNLEKFTMNDGTTEGCLARSSSLIDKAGGNFRFDIAEIPESERLPGTLPKAFNISHTIRSLCFSPTVIAEPHENLHDLSRRISDLTTIVPDNTGVYHYAIQVVPTQYKTLYGELSYVNQHSVVEKAISLEQLTKIQPVSGVHLQNFKGVIFTYDFHPVMLYMEERREKIIDFISNLFGIVGGVITVLSLLEGILHRSTKAVIGKKD